MIQLTELRSGMEVLSRQECVALLRRKEGGVGRLAVVVGGRPRVFPVNFVMSDDRVLFLTDEGTKLDVARRGAPVAFEIDHVDHQARFGWSVVVEGTAQVVRDPALITLLGALGLWPYASGAKRHWVVIEPDSITGRRVPMPRPSWIR